MRRLFERHGLLMVPAHPLGWAMFAGVLAVVVRSFLVIDARSHSVSDTLMNFAFRVLVIAAMYTLAAMGIDRLQARRH